MQAVDHKKRQFERLSASLYDFSQANFCACYLLKKGWHAKEWERRGTIYQQQTAFVTNLVIAYARPFTASNGWPGFPSKLANFDARQRKMHNRLLAMRHKIFAHSDSQHFTFKPVAGRFRGTIEGVPSAVLSVNEAECVKQMTEDLLKATRKKLDELHLKICPDEPH